MTLDPLDAYYTFDGEQWLRVECSVCGTNPCRAEHRQIVVPWVFLFPFTALLMPWRRAIRIRRRLRSLSMPALRKGWE